MTSDQDHRLLARLNHLEQSNALLRSQLDAARRASAHPSADTPDIAQERYQFLFNTMDEGFCIIEFFDGPHGPLSDYIHVEANPAYAMHAGIPNVVGQKLREMVGDEADAWMERYGHVLHTGESIRFEQELVATGRYLDVTAFRVEPASRRQVAVLFQDVTARKRAEAALRRLNETLEERVQAALAAHRILADVVDGAAALIYVMDDDFRWLAINGSGADVFERIFGQRPQVGDCLLDLLDEHVEARDTLLDQWRRAFAGEEFSEIVSLGTPDERRHYELEFTPLHDAAGRRIGAYQFAYDVTDRLNEQERVRLIEEALRQAQKMEAVGQLTGGIAHDFNNLLTGVLGSLELLEQRILQGRLDNLERYTGTARGAAQRAAALTHRLLAFSRRQTLDPQTVAVDRLVAGMEELIRRSIGPQIHFEREHAQALWPTHIDGSQLENALLNLCLNARDAMPGGGRILITTANETIDATRAAAEQLPEGQYVRLSVADSGIGMTSEVRGRAFDPFFTTKPLGEGTGLGLSMVHGFVHQSGGEIRIESTPGEGTHIHLYLPRHRQAQPPLAVPSQAPSLSAQGQGETLLVIDDEPTVRHLVVEVAQDLGYHVLEASDASTGLALIESATHLDLLITDVGLPGDLNGRQLADAARHLRSALRVLFITGYAEASVIGDGELEPGMRVLTKPFGLEALEQRIHEMLQRS